MTSLNAAGRQQSRRLLNHKHCPDHAAKLDGAALEARTGAPVHCRCSVGASVCMKQLATAEKNRYPDVTLMIAPTRYGSGIDSCFMVSSTSRSVLMFGARRNRS
jgi:hypothetical protein